MHTTKAKNFTSTLARIENVVRAAAIPCGEMTTYLKSAHIRVEYPLREASLRAGAVLTVVVRENGRLDIGIQGPDGALGLAAALAAHELMTRVTALASQISAISPS